MITPIPVIIPTVRVTALSHTQANWAAALPQQYVGTLYAKVRPPFCPFGIWFRVPVWGQVCDGRDHRDAVHLMLYNKFPFRGRGWRYVEWSAEPSCPELNDAPRRGKLANPVPYDGTAFH